MKIVNPISMAKLHLAILFTFPDAYQGYSFDSILHATKEEIAAIHKENNEEWYKILTTALNVYQSAELIRKEKSFYFAGLENAFQKKCTDIKSDMLGLFISSEHYIDTTRILMSFDFSWLAQYGIPSSLEAETYFIQRLADDMVKRGVIETHPNNKSLYRPAMGHRAISIKEKGTTMDFKRKLRDAIVNMFSSDKPNIKFNQALSDLSDLFGQHSNTAESPVDVLHRELEVMVKLGILNYTYVDPQKMDSEFTAGLILKLYPSIVVNNTNPELEPPLKQLHDSIFLAVKLEGRVRTTTVCGQNQELLMELEEKTGVPRGRLVDDMMKLMELEGDLVSDSSTNLYPLWSLSPAALVKPLPKIPKKVAAKPVSISSGQAPNSDVQSQLNKALEIIAVQFLQKEIDELGGQVPVAANGTSFDSPKVALLKRVRGLIKDHGLEFRLSKPKQDHFDVPEEICQVQLTKLLYPTDADLLETIVDLFVNEGH